MKKLFLLLTIATIIVSSCTENQRARKFGGKEDIQLPKHHILINVSWKESNLWIVTKDTTTNIYYCREKSSWGLWEGEIQIK